MIALAAVLLLMQFPYPESPREPVPAGSPRTDAIPRQYSELDPQGALEKLRNEGILPWSGKPTRAQLLIQNMDSDPDSEFVILAEDFSFKIAIVMKQVDGKWWTLGTFVSRASGDLDTFVSLKPLVWSGTYDLLLREGGSQGTGVGSFHRTVYRILRGNLYQVFSEVEDSWNWTSTESAKFEYREQMIVVRRTRKKTGGPESKSCAAYRWSLRQFAFHPEPCR